MSRFIFGRAAIAVSAATVLLLSACSSDATTSTPTPAPSGTPAAAATTPGSADASTPPTAGGEGSSAAAPISGAGKTIAFIPGCTCDPYYSTETSGFEAAMAAAGATALVQGPADFAAAPQITVLEAIVEKKPDAIIIDPTDATALAGPIEAAVAAGIPVMTTGNNVNTDKIFTAIAASSVEGGKLAAQAIIDANPEGGEVVFIHIKPGISSIDDREKGFREVMGANAKFTILENLYAGDDSATQTAGLVDPVIAAHPKLVGIFASNVITANGAAVSIAAAGKSGQITAIGYDASAQEITDMQAGSLTATISQNPYKIGQLAVENTLRFLGGDTSIPKDQPLVPFIITMENLNTPEAQSAIYK